MICAHCGTGFERFVLSGSVLQPEACARCWRERTTTRVHTESEDYAYKLYAHAQADDSLVRIGSAEHHARGGYSFHFDRSDLTGMRRWILASLTPLKTWAEFGLTALPDTMDDMHLWADSTLVLTGSRLPHGYCSGVAERILLVLRPKIVSLPASAVGFHALDNVYECPIEGCKLVAFLGRPLCIDHWSAITPEERSAVWKAPPGDEGNAVMRGIAEKRGWTFSVPSPTAPELQLAVKKRKPRAL